MHTLIVLAAAVAACAFARPQAGSAAHPGFVIPHLEPQRERVRIPIAKDYINEYLAPRLLMPRYSGFDESPRAPPAAPTVRDHEWLNKEIDRINEMEEDEEDDVGNAYDVDMTRWISTDTDLHRLLEDTLQEHRNYLPEYAGSLENMGEMEASPYKVTRPLNHVAPQRGVKRLPTEDLSDKEMEHKKTFALTPYDKGYFDPDTRSKSNSGSSSMEKIETEVEPKMAMLLQPPRQIRQNPNLSRTKTLVAENINLLRSGVANKELKLPVSLLPTNLRWLKINDDKTESSHEDGATDRPRHVHLHETTEAQDSTYGVVMLAAVGAALTVILAGFGFVLYTISQRAKAAADVDYPAYGVTGPTMDNSGDRKLAHSAHMYHYQHQKQQIIAMERNGMEQRNGSVSDPESEEENEEGDYTVYECPGFATTGDIEVKNPLFSDDPTPATPGKIEVVKSQPKE